MAHSFVCKYKVEQVVSSIDLTPHNLGSEYTGPPLLPLPSVGPDDPFSMSSSSPYQSRHAGHGLQDTSAEQNPDDLYDLTESINPVQQQRIVEVRTTSNLPVELIIYLLQEGLIS